jgi:GT2 family glycosyltransferase
MPRLGVSILNYRAADQTVRCVRSLLAAQMATKVDVELNVHVADNASGNAEFESLHAALRGQPGVFLHRHDQNLGFAAGHNRNIERLLRAETPDFVWLLNNDCLVDRGAIAALLDCVRNQESVGIWGATLLEDDGETIQCAGGCYYNAWLSSYQQHGHGEPASSRGDLSRRKFSYIAGASLFIPVPVLETGLRPPKSLKPNANGNGSQWLNETFFLYFEELDLAQRLVPELGLGWCRDALITHMGGKGTEAGGGQRSAQAEYHSTLSALKFTRLYYPRRLWFTAPARFFAKALQLLITGNISLLGSVASAYVDFWRYLHTNRD